MAEYDIIMGEYDIKLDGYVIILGEYGIKMDEYDIIKGAYDNILGVHMITYWVVMISLLYSTPVDFITGSNVTLTCMVRGKPSPTIVWTKQSAEDSLSNTDTIYQSDNELFFSSIRREDEGVYSCIASNSFGTVSQTSLLTVLAMGKYPVYVFINT